MITSLDMLSQAFCYYDVQVGALLGVMHLGGFSLSSAPSGVIRME
jgi:hypothetical protein